MSEWQPIETAPKDGTHILIARLGEGLREMEITYWYVIKATRYEHIQDDLYRKITVTSSEGWNGNGHRATHWMPLPEPPK